MIVLIAYYFIIVLTTKKGYTNEEKHKILLEFGLNVPKGSMGKFNTVCSNEYNEAFITWMDKEHTNVFPVRPFMSDVGAFLRLHNDSNCNYRVTFHKCAVEEYLNYYEQHMKCAVTS